MGLGKKLKMVSKENFLSFEQKINNIKRLQFHQSLNLILNNNINLTIICTERTF
jgi:hypothetical protein